MAMDMKQTDRSIDINAGRQQVSDAKMKVDEILTYNVINKHCALFGVKVGFYKVLENSKVDMSLTFSFIKIDDAVWNETPVPGASKSDNPSNVASLGILHRLFNSSEVIFTGSSLR